VFGFHPKKVDTIHPASWPQGGWTSPEKRLSTDERAVNPPRQPFGISNDDACTRS